MDYAFAANEGSSRLFTLICAAIKNHRGTHIETAITAAGYLTGYELLRASKIDFSSMTPGSAVFGSPGVDDSGPMVLDFIITACQNAGIQELPTADLEYPPAHAPLQSYMQLMTTLLSPYRQLVDRLPSPAGRRWIIPAQTAVQLIHAGQDVLQPAIAQVLAIQAVVSGAKTIPPRYGTSKSPQTK